MQNVMVLDKQYYIVEEQFSEHIKKQYDIEFYTEDFREDLSLFVDEFKEINKIENICSKNEAIALVKEFFDFTNPYLELRVSHEVVNIWDVRDVFERRIFSDAELLQGWFVWIDPCNIANWSHECYYYFILNNKKIFKSTESWMPSGDLKMYKYC